MKIKAVATVILLLSFSAFASSPTGDPQTSVIATSGTIELNIDGEAARALYNALTGVEEARLNMDQYDVEMGKFGKNIFCYVTNGVEDSTSKCFVKFDLSGMAQTTNKTEAYRAHSSLLLVSESLLESCRGGNVEDASCGGKNVGESCQNYDFMGVQTSGTCQWKNWGNGDGGCLCKPPGHSPTPIQ